MSDPLFGSGKRAIPAHQPDIDLNAAGELAADLNDTYEHLWFYVAKRDAAGLEPGLRPSHVVLFSSEDMCVVDPRTDPHGKREVDPYEQYGIHDRDADRIIEHNGVRLA